MRRKVRRKQAEDAKKCMRREDRSKKKGRKKEKREYRMRGKE